MVLIFISLMAVNVEQLIMHYNVAFGDVLAC